MYPSATPEPDFHAEARVLLRRWTAGSEGEVTESVAAIGAAAIRAAAATTERLARLPSDHSAERTLANLETLAAGFTAPPPPKGILAFLRPAPAPVDPQPRIAQLVENLDRERDAVARATLMIEGDAKRLREAATALDHAVRLVRACAAAVEAGARELALDQPERARFLRETVAAQLVERERDLLTQAAVTDQGTLTLRLLAEGQAALAQALTRARDTSIAALRTALAARRAAEANARLHGQAITIDGATDVDRVVREALDEARRDAGARTPR